MQRLFGATYEVDAAGAGAAAGREGAAREVLRPVGAGGVGAPAHTYSQNRLNTWRQLSVTPLPEEGDDPRELRGQNG